MLYHYTCSHSAQQIADTGELRPHRQVALRGELLVWLTDLDRPDRDALGLTSHTLDCDRTEWRVTVQVGYPLAQRWVDYARRYPLGVRRQLELAPGALPMHWWVVDSSALAIKSIERAGLGSGS